MRAPRITIFSRKTFVTASYGAPRESTATLTLDRRALVAGLRSLARVLRSPRDQAWTIELRSITESLFRPDKPPRRRAPRPRSKRKRLPC